MFLFVLGLLLVHFYMPRLVTEIKNPLVKLLRGHPQTTSKDPKMLNPKVGRILKVASFDGTEIVGYEKYSMLDTTIGTIILVHGIRSNKEHFNQFSNRLANEGFNAIALDLRGHGESGGTHCSFGVFEKRDITKLLDQIRIESPDQKIGILGQSLGGAVALQAMGEDERISVGVIESTFTDFRTITHDYINYHLKLDFNFFSNYLADRAGKIAGFNPDEAGPLESCKKISKPVLLVHGKLDDRIDIKYARENFTNLQHEDCKLLEIEDADHVNVWQKGGEAYFEEVIAYLKQHI